jgi:hypothetical protein
MFRVFWSAIFFAATAPALVAATHTRTIPLAGIEVMGFALDAGRLFVWGEGAFAIDLRSGERERIAQGRFAEGGCVFNGGLILNSVAPRELIWLRLSDRKRFVVDTGVDTRDVIAADLLGHHGVLLIHKRQQVRFYDWPSPMKDKWSETELYTIYTPSTEGGLVLADIDGDGLPDLLCGNYWMKSPTRFELPWREFAIDTWNEEEGSAMLKLAWSSPVRVAAQRDMQPSRAAWFARAEDPKQLWTAHDLLPGQPLSGVSGALFIEKDLLISERNSPGRVLFFRRTRDGFAPGKELIRTNKAIGMAALSGRRVLLIEKSQVVLLRW